MSGWRWRPSVRLRLTLWHVGAMAVVLVAYAAGVFTVVSGAASQGLDSRLRSDFLWAEEMVDQTPDGRFAWFIGDGHGGDEDSPWLQVWSPTGRLLYRTAVAESSPLSETSQLASRADGRIALVHRGIDTFRVLSGPSTIALQPVVIQVARSERPMQQDLRKLLLVLVLGLPLGVAAAGFAGYSVARRALAPIDRMAERARSITADRLSGRLPVDNPNDELGRLATVFNATLGRLESSFERMRQFTADVSHELRTPLTAIRSVGEVGLRGRRDERAYRAIISSMLEEVDRLTCLVDRRLALSRAEAGATKLSLDVVDLYDVAEEVAAHLGVLAEEKQQALTTERLGTPRVVGDRLVLRQALINLVDNAIKYSPAGARIAIRVSGDKANGVIEVSDTGPGIAADAQARIFDRFFRADKSPTDGISGAGLGLTIARCAVEANGGALDVESRPGVGSTFTITLPAAAAAAGTGTHG